MKKLLVICDSEKTYGKRLYEYLLKRQGSYYEIKLYTSVDIMINNLKGVHVDILVIDETSYVEFCADTDKKQVKADKIKILSSVRQGPDLIAEESIYKYQSAKDIFNILIQECRLFPSYSLSDTPDTQIYSVYSPLQLRFKNCLPFAMAKTLSDSHKILFMSFEECPVLHKQLNIKTDVTVYDLVYDFLLYENEYPGRLKNFIEHIFGIDVIPPIQSLTELQCIKGSDILRIVNMIKISGIYEYAVIDIGSCVNGIADIMKVSDRIFMPVLSDEASADKIESLENTFIKDGSYEMFKGKIKKFEMPKINNMPFNPEMLKYGEFGEFVSKLCS